MWLLNYDFWKEAILGGSVVWAGKQRTWLTCMLPRVSYRGANEDLPDYFCLIFDLKKIDFLTFR
jgi:hypothetical protein